MTRSRLVLSLLFLTLSWLGAIAPARADSSASAAYFYDDLAPYGRWVDHRVYGTVWVPASHEPGWHPYEYGRWVWTTDYGWYWDSDEEFGWATYHYGRWVFTSDLGWVWVPDDVWGPAWVDWRYEDGYVGWAPMPPEYRWRRGAFVAIDVDLAAPRYSSSWIFVTEGDFARADVHRHRVSSSRNSELLSSSSRVTNYASINGRIVNRSIDPARIALRTKTHIVPAHLRISSSLEEREKIRASGLVPLYRPRLLAKSKLDLSTGTTDKYISTEVDQGLRVPDKGDVDPLPSGNISSGVDAGVSPGGVLDQSIGGGLGAGIGGGIGGGLRIGR